MKVREVVGELLGTYAFVLLGPGTGVVGGAHLGGAKWIAIAAGNGVALFVMITIFAGASGAHFNPAITLSAWVGRKIQGGKAVGYVACQVVGALGAALTFRFVLPASMWRPAHVGTPTLTVSPLRGLAVEGGFTFVLALVVWATGFDERGPHIAPYAVGITVFIGIWALGPLTGGAFNPARYFGPALVAGELSDWWVYVLGPAAGAAVAAVVYTTIRRGRTGRDS